MDLNTYLHMDACTLAAHIKKGKVSPEEALNFAIERCEQVNPHLNAITHRFEEWGRQQLKKMSGSERFYGVPLLVKELGFTIAGQPARAGSRLLAHNLAQYNHVLIEQFLALGFVPFALTNTPEFGLSYTTEPELFGACKNPYDLSKTAGGSSGGSAAAVATGVVPLATASDGGGSIRVPATCCGLVGFKPSSGLLPSGPISVEPWSGMAVDFALGRNLKDISALFRALIRQTSGPALPFQSKEKPHFIHCPGLFPPIHIESKWQQALETFINELKTHHYQVSEPVLRLDHEAIGECSLTIIKANVAAELQRIQQITQKPVKEEELEPITWRFYQDGLTLSAHQLILAKDRLFQLLAPLRNLLADGSVILSPALAKDPVNLGELSMADEYETYLEKNLAFSPFTALCNQTGIPAISLPVQSKYPLPLAVQLIMGKWRDAQLLDLCKTLKKIGLWQEYPVVSPLLD